MAESNFNLSQTNSSQPGNPSDFKIEGPVLLSYKGTESHLIVPEGIEVIGQDAFFKNSFLKGLVLPDSLKTIESKAFFACKNLESVTMKGQITFIGDFAFADCTAIRIIHIPQSVRTIGKFAFSYVFGRADIKALEKQSSVYVELPKNLEELGEGSFLGSDGIIIYDKLRSQAGRALYDPDKASGHWIDSIRFKPHLIMLKSTRTDQILAAVWTASKDERREYLTTLMDLWERDMPFAFEEYDQLFQTMVSTRDKINVAFYRLQYPYDLHERHKNIYEDFLKKQAVHVVGTISHDYKLQALQLLANRSMLTVENIDPIFELLNNEGNTKCVSWIMNYKNKNRLKNHGRLTL